jgi:hypothetical protein
MPRPTSSDAARIPFLEKLAAAQVLQGRGEQGRVVLLDGKHLQAGALGINVGDVIAVAVNEFGR